MEVQAVATKINQTIWGTVPATGAAIRTATNTLGTCYNNGTFDPADISTLDRSIVPWGIGYGGLGGFSILKKARLPIPIEGSSYPKIGTLTTFDIEEFVETNNPVTFMMTGNINNPTSNNWFSHRLSGGVKGSSTAFTSDAAYDKDSSIPEGASSQYMWQFKPIVYLDYQKVMCQVQAVHLWKIPAGNHIRTTNLSNYPESGYSWEDYELLGFDYEIYYKNAADNAWISSGYYTALPINEKTTSKYILDRYFGQNVRPAKFTPYTFCASVRTTVLSSTGSFTYYDNAILRETDIETVGSGSLLNSDMHEYGNYINNTQTFDDVSYTMEKKCGFNVNGTWIEIVKGGTLPGGENSSVSIASGVYYKINGYEGGSKLDAWTKIISHEMAFLGLPYQIKINGDAGTPASTLTIAADGVYLPIFDIEHMLTTGRYATGSAKTSLPNYSWNDIFDNSIPEWDSSYNPPKPSGSTGDENDGGNLNNRVYRNIRLGGSNYFYALDESELRAFINFVNGMYTTDADDTKLKLDFKGSNPNDYIVGVYGYPFDIPNTVHASNVYLGPVETTVNANVVNQGNTGYFTFGSLAIEPYYNDFRDFAPYTQIELYIPLCGTVELDAAYYIGHIVTVDCIYDINTGALTARIFRDDTLDRTIDGAGAVQIPITSRDMGSYQNNVHQLRQNLISAGISGVMSTEKMITGGISTAAQSYGSSNHLSAMSVSTADIAASSFESGRNIANAKYNLSHIQPRVAVSSTASDGNAMQMYNKAMLFIKRAKTLDGFNPEFYAKTVGYACLKNTTLSDSNISGFTVCSDCDLSGIPATADEINAIQAALHSGIYL